jgi:hypothetical protein
MSSACRFAANSGSVQGAAAFSYEILRRTLCSAATLVDC